MRDLDGIDDDAKKREIIQQGFADAIDSIRQTEIEKIIGDPEKLLEDVSDGEEL